MKQPAETISPMKNPIMLDRQRDFHLRMVGVAHLAKEYGSVGGAIKRLQDVNFADMTVDDIDVIINFLFAGLTADDKTLTVEQLYAVVDIGDMSKINEVIAQAFRKDMPEPKEGAEENPTKQA